MNCIDVAKDAVWIGKDCIVPCVNVDLCKANGCYWRLFHELRPEQFAQADNRPTTGDLFDE